MHERENQTVSSEIFLKNNMKLPCFLSKLRGSWKGTWSCFRFSKRFFVLAIKLVLFFHSCQIVIYPCFAGKASSPLALNVQRKTFQFCKAAKIVSKFIILLLTFYTRSLSCLIF